MLFVEVGGFTAMLPEYLDDEGYRGLQNELLEKPKSGKKIRDTHGVRKLRWSDARRGKGKRGGLRVIYYFHEPRDQIWMIAIYDKDEAEDLTAADRKAIGTLVLELIKES